jgi:ribonuclease HI
MSVTLPIIKPSKKQVDCKFVKIYPTTEYVLYFDGCSKGNPGRAGIGAVIYKNNVEYWSSYKYIGDKRTNNEAEYSALIFGLESALNHNIEKLSVCGDSLLVINQINGDYKVKNEKLFKLYDKVVELKKLFTYIDFNHVYRKDNKRADELSNIALNNDEEEFIIDDSIKIKR